MATLENQVKAFSGSVPAGADIDVILADGCKDIIRRISLTTPEDLWMFTTNTDVPAAGLGIGTSKLYDVTRDNKPCSVIAAQLRHRAAESDSIHYATGEFPNYYLLNGKVFVLPTPSEVDATDISLFSSYDDGTFTQITSTAHGYSKGDYITIMQEDEILNDVYFVGKFRVFYVIDVNNYVIEKNYVATDTTGYSCQLPGASADYIAAHTVNSETGTIENFPDSYTPLVVLYGAMGVLLAKAAVIHDTFPSLVLPAAPVVPNLITSSESLPTYNTPAPFVLPVVPADVNVDFSGITPPSWSDIASPVLEVLNFSISNIEIDTLALSVDIPVPPSLPTFSDSAVDFASIVRSKAPVYNKPVLTIPTFPTIPSFVSPLPPAAPVIPEFSDGAITAANSNVPDYAAPVLGTLDFPSVETSISTDEDPEMAGVKLNQIQAKVSVFQAESSDKVNEWQNEMTEYKAKIEQAQATATNLLSSESAEFQAILNKYQAEIQTYQAEATAAAAEWSKNNLEHKYTRWVADWQNSLGAYQSDIQNELNSFQRENSEYQAELQKAMTDASNVMGIQNNEATAIISKYSTEIQGYSAKTNVLVSEWQQRIAQTALQEFTQKRSDELAEWTGKAQNNMTLYSNDITQEKSKFDSSFQVYSQEINQALQEYQAETGYDMTKYSAEVQSATQRYQLDAQKELELYKSNLERYAAEQANTSAKNSDSFNKYQTEVGMYQADSGNVINKYNAKVQSNQAEMQWMLDRYTTISTKYETGFLAEPTKDTLNRNA